MGKLLHLVVGQAGGRYSLMVLAGVIFGAVASSLFAEKTAWAYFTLGVVGLIPLALFFNNRAIVHLYGLLGILLLMAGVYWLDAVQETDREQVLRKSHELVRAVETTDFAAFDRHISDNYVWQGMSKKALMDRARRVLLPSQSRSCSISSAQVNGKNGDPTLVVSGNLAATGQFGSENAFFTGLIDMTYTKQPDGQYRLTGTRVQYPGGLEVVLPSR